jgi:H+/Cl- antiporter ClcA
LVALAWGERSGETGVLEESKQLNKEHHLMKRFSMKKKLVAGAAVATLVIGVGAAYAVWSTTGSGSGSAKATTNQTSTVTEVASPAADANLWPGGPAVPVSFTLNNPNPYAVTFTTFSDAAVGTVTPGTLAGTTCAFTLSATSGSLAAPVVVPANTSVALGVAGSSSAILQMTHASDDSCQGATALVTLNVQGSQN